MIDHSKSGFSFRTQALIASFGLQCLFVIIFAVALLFLISERAEQAFRDNYAATTAGYAKNAAFVFISSLDENRADFLSAASASPTIKAAFMTRPDFKIIALTEDHWRSTIEIAHAQAPGESRPVVIEGSDHWIFYEPVFATDVHACRDSPDGQKACDRELLGFLGVIGSKDMIHDLTWNLGVVLLTAAVILLGLIYWVTDRLSQSLYNPMAALAAGTRKAADSGYRTSLAYSGPPEVAAVAASINHLIGRASANAEMLEAQVAEKTREEREARTIAESARAYAEEIKQRRTELMSIQTHELLTPLRNLIGELDNTVAELRFLPAGRTRNEVQRRLLAMRSPIGRIEEIISQLNLAMRIDENLIEVRVAHASLAPMIDRLREQYDPIATRARNRLVLQSVSQNGVTTDHSMLEAIASNLISNACKFTESGEIRFTVDQVARELQVTCEDTGAGIPEGKRNTIFEPFYQADMTSRRIADGLGLGLSIVKGLVDRLGGSVKVESREGEGTRIIVLLPCNHETAEKAAE